MAKLKGRGGEDFSSKFIMDLVVTVYRKCLFVEAVGNLCSFGQPHNGTDSKIFGSGKCMLTKTMNAMYI